VSKVYDTGIYSKLLPKVSNIPNMPTNIPNMPNMPNLNSINGELKTELENKIKSLSDVLGPELSENIKKTFYDIITNNELSVFEKNKRLLDLSQKLNELSPLSESSKNTVASAIGGYQSLNATASNANNAINSASNAMNNTVKGVSDTLNKMNPFGKKTGGSNKRRTRRIAQKSVSKTHKYHYAI
jgi:hypothetical protein